VTAVLLAPSAAFSLGVRIPNQDPEAIARGNAFAATADNPSAIYYNPAGITQLEGNNFQFGALSYLGIYVDYESPTGNKVSNDPNLFVIPHLYYTYTPKDLPLSFGMGIYAPFGLGMKWPQDSGFRTSSIEAELQYITLNPVVAWKILPSLSVAGGPTFNYSEILLRTGLVSPTPVPNDEFKFDGNGWSYGFNFGVLWQPFSKWSFGLNYRSASKVDYEGDTQIKSPVPVIPSGSVSTSVETDFPQIITGGVSFRPTPQWNIEVNVDYSDWNTMNTLVFSGTSALLGQNATLPLNWHGSWFYEAGVTYYFDTPEQGYHISSGFFFSSETSGERDFNPSIPDTDLYVGSVGVGYRGKHWRWAVAAQIIAGPWRDIDNAAAPVVNGSYKLWTPTLSASLGYHF